MLSNSTLVIFMILNGVIFVPPSEYLYFDAYFGLEGEFAYIYLVLPIANAVGHYFLYELSKRYRSKLEILESKEATGFLLRTFQYIVRSSRNYFEIHDTHAWAVLYGRCVPVVHSGISIVAGIFGVSRLRFLILTVVGNILFSAVCWIVVKTLSRVDNYNYSIVLVGFFFIAIYLLHTYIERRLNKRSK